ncbi:MAG TPA: SIS domain-containing protein [Chloroflexota bacterium]
MARVKGSTFLEEEIVGQGDVLEAVLQRRPAEVDEVVASCLAREPRDWVVTGCGDSLFAGLCAEVWFANAAATPLRAIHALHFSRYLYKSVNQHSIVFALSYSGNTARAVEAAVAAKSQGAMVVAITANADSRLVEIADLWLPNDAEHERSNCRTGSFAAAALLLRMVADRVAAASGLSPLPPPDGLPQVVRELSWNAAQPVRRIVDALPDGLSFTVIGSGYSYPVVQYGSAKLYEAATIPAHVSELEQFVHCEIFPVGATSCVMLTAPRGPSSERAVEIAGGLRELGAITIGITDDPELAGQCTYSVSIPEGCQESLMPFLATIPFQYFGLYWALRLGDNPDLVSNKRVNRPLIERSAQWTAADYRTVGVAASAE